jgi:asparagine synthase (glutamine-hydrolysing)
MCGILWSIINEKINLEFITQQFEKIKHRGPDNSNFVQKGDYFLGTHRLAITNLSEQGNQPFETNDLTLICNGQIYNANDLVSRCNTHDILKGEVDILRSDVDIFTKLYTLYEMFVLPTKWTSMMQDIDGDFAVVLMDSGKDRLIIARDHVGVRPLFYCTSKETGKLVAVASEAKALEDYPNVDVFVYPPYHYSVVDLNEMSITFTSYKEEKQINYSTKLFYIANEGLDHREQIVSVLRESVYKRIDESHQPVAFLLSGGIDSAIIACIAHEYLEKTGRKMHCFCMKFKGDRSDDCEYATILANLLKVELTIVEFDWEDVLGNIENIIYQIESYDPNTIRASVPMYLLCKYLRENTSYKVFLSGEGADELFAGYFYFNYCETGKDLNKETQRLTKNIHMFDVLRADRCFAAHGLEVRVPYLDKKFIETVFNIDGDYKKFNQGIEKHLLRECFRSIYPALSSSRILDRVKERFSDGVSFQYVPRLLNHYSDPSISQLADKELCEKTKYKEIFNGFYKNKEHLIILRELPDWVKQVDKKGKLLVNDDDKVKEGENKNKEHSLSCLSSLSEKDKNEEKEMIKFNIENSESLIFASYKTFEPFHNQSLDKKLSNIDKVVQHLLIVQNTNMLDMTKCSETSRNIYNFIVDNKNKDLQKETNVKHYDNLEYIEPNLESLNEEIEKDGDKIFYIHFKHFIGENSHYFILYKTNNEVYLLQSAVFEFSFRDWVYPELRKSESLETFTKNITKIMEDSDETYNERENIYVNNEISVLKKNYGHVKQIKECKYSCGNPINAEYFINKLKKISGCWNTKNIDTKIQIYSELFSCKLNKPLVENEIRLDAKNNAIVKWISHNI